MIAVRTERLVAMAAFMALGLASCGKQDWRAQAIARAESQIRAQVGDATAQFSRVQVTGDDKTGQTCGFVAKSADANGSGKVGRFIVYIDQSAGPFIESDIGNQAMSQQAFDQAWQGDCLGEGYNA